MCNNNNDDNNNNHIYIQINKQFYYIIYILCVYIYIYAYYAYIYIYLYIFEIHPIKRWLNLKPSIYILMHIWNRYQHAPWRWISRVCEHYSMMDGMGESGILTFWII